MKKLIPLLSLLLIISCSRPKADDSDTVGEYIPELDTATSLIDTVPQTDTVKVEPVDYTEAEYQDGILPVIAVEHLNTLRNWPLKVRKDSLYATRRV